MQALHVPGMIAGEGIGQFLAVRLQTSDFTVKELKVKTVTPFMGISQEKVKNGVPIDVIGYGASKAKLGGAVTRGAFLTPHTDASLVATTTAANHVVAIALEDGADDAVIKVWVVPTHRYA